MKLLYSGRYEDVAFGLRFVDCPISFIKEGDEITLEHEGGTEKGTKAVLSKIKQLSKDPQIARYYLEDNAIEKLAKLHRTSTSELPQLRYVDVEGGKFSIFDAAAFAHTYRSLLEGKKVSEKTVDAFLLIQEKLATKVSFVTYSKPGFECLDIRVGRIIQIEAVKGSDKLFVEKIIAHKEFQVVSGLQKHYTKEDLLNKQFLFILNIRPVMLAGIRSEGMILCVSSSQKVEAICISDDVETGTKVELKRSSVPVIEEFEQAVLDLRKSKNRGLMSNLCVRNHEVLFGECEVLCKGSAIKTAIESGPIS